MISTFVKTTSLLAIDFPRITFSALFRRRMLPQAVRRMIVRMGPVYIKVAQVLSTRRDMLPDEYIREFVQLREFVPPMSRRQVQKILNKSYAGGIDRYFRSFDINSIAAGSVAQVHTAYLHSGEKVAVKILRPGILKDIKNNMRLLMFIASLGEKLSRNLAAMNVRGMLGEICDLLCQQADLDREARNYLRFHEAYANDEHIRIPKLYTGLSSTNVLVVAFVEAIHPDNHQAVPIPALQLAKRLDRLLDNMLFLRGLVHADMHPGNFFWDAEGHLVLIDLGLVHELSQDDRNHLMTFYYAVVDGYYAFAARYFMQFLVVPMRGDVKQDEAVVVKEAVALLEKHYVQSDGRPKFAGLFQDLLALLGRRRFKLYPGFTNIFLTLITVEGYLYALDPGFDMIENARNKRIDEMEYANVPEEAVQLVLGEHGTYSTARFNNGITDPQQAYRSRNEFVLQDCLQAVPGRFMMDIGCGRGGLLLAAKQSGLRTLGVTINRAEKKACEDKGLEIVRSAWEDFEKNAGDQYPPADYVTIVEVLSHLGSLHENRVGLVGERLRRLFKWLDQRVADNGRVYLQEMVVDHDLLHDSQRAADFQRVTTLLPWVGFTVLEQIISASAPWFEVLKCEEHTQDIPPTYHFFQSRVDTARERLNALLKPDVVAYIEGEIHGYRTLALDRTIKLYRICMQKKPLAQAA